MSIVEIGGGGGDGFSYFVSHNKVSRPTIYSKGTSKKGFLTAVYQEKLQFRKIQKLLNNPTSKGVATIHNIK